jgi:hypothetical protein
VADDVSRPRPFKVGGVKIPRRVLYGSIVVALYIGGAAFAVAYPHLRAPSKSPAPPAAVGTCWDGSGVMRGEKCSTGYDERALYWAFNIDPADVTCERSKSYSWSDLGLSCTYRGKDLRMAVWNSPTWRDRRLVEYGDPKPVGRGLMLHQPGSADRYLLRYDSEQVLIYASVKSKDGEVLDKLRPRVRSLRQLLYGVKVSGP